MHQKRGGRFRVTIMSIWDNFDEIIAYAHFRNWAPDWGEVKDIYRSFPNSFSVLTPFAYTYLEELIKSRTSEYGCEIVDSSGREIRRRTGKRLIELAREENQEDHAFLSSLDAVEGYFSQSSSSDRGTNRNSTVHGFMHAGLWYKESFEKLISDIASISKYAGF